MGDPLDPFGWGLPPFGPPVFPPIGGILPIGPIGPIAPLLPIAPIDAKQAPPIVHTDRSLAVPFFLKPNNSVKDMEFLGPIRQAQEVKPLIDGIEAFIEMEDAITAAKSSVLLAFWAFDPATPLRTDTSKTWIDMLKDAGKRGVNVRLFVTDYDPGFNLFGHVHAWTHYFDMYRAAGTLPAERFQLVCSRHEAETTPDTAKAVKPALYDDVVLTINALDEADRRRVWKGAPGIWDKLDFDAGTAKVKRKKPGEHYPIYPAVHHNKLLIVDGQVAFTGGMNIEPSYHDLPTHDELAQPWHDAFVKVEGSLILRDFLRCYIGLWNQERVRCEKFLTDAFAQRGTAATISKTTDLEISKLVAKPTTGVTAKILSQIHRTVTRKGTSAFGIPDVVRKDILDGYLLAISKAEQFIYIENQYVREQAMIDAIIQRAKDKPELRVIFLMPKIAEEFKGDVKAKIDEVNMYGAALQHELIEKMKKALRKRLGLYAMLKKDGMDVYVHSKLFIIDDQFASIGSANTNPRGFRMDTELDFTWHSRTVTEQLRFDLWDEILGYPRAMKSWKPKEFINKWNTIAARNNGRGGVQQGFVVPFENKEKGAKHLLVDLGPFT